MSTSANRRQAILAHRRLPLAAAALAVTLTLPALGAGLVGDDYFHRLILLRQHELTRQMNPMLDLFSFVPEQHRAVWIDIGILPWWTSPDIRVAMGRPLTALSHRLDYALWPDHAPLQHLHSLLWFGLAVGLVARLYRRVHGPTIVAGLAALLFAVEDAHVWPAAWLANRNALLCLVCGTLALLAHIAWRETGRRRHLLGALVALAAGLGCGEATLGALGYVIAWQAVEQGRSWTKRLLPLTPYVLLVVAWRLLYQAAGYGTVGSSLYVDPGQQPLSFLQALVERWPLLAAAQWLPFPVDLWLLLPRSGQWVASLVAAACAAGVVALVAPLLRENRLARFWGLGLALSLVPTCAAFPMARLLVFAGMGAFAVLGLLVQRLGVWPFSHPGRSGWPRPSARALVALHGPISALLLVVGAASMPVSAQFFAAGARRIPTDPAVAAQTVVFVNGNDFPVVYGWVIRQVEGGAPTPRRIAHLSPASTASRIHREDAHTLVITAEEGFLARPMDRLLVDPARRFASGESIARPDFRAEVRSTTADGRPESVAFRFHEPLESATYRWLLWDAGVAREVRPPATGDTLRVRASAPFQ